MLFPPIVIQVTHTHISNYNYFTILLFNFFNFRLTFFSFPFPKIQKKFLLVTIILNHLILPLHMVATGSHVHLTSSLARPLLQCTTIDLGHVRLALRAHGTISICSAFLISPIILNSTLFLSPLLSFNQKANLRANT